MSRNYVEIVAKESEEQTLYQWDTDRKLKVLTDDGITVDEVHFSNAFTQQALIVVPTASVELGCMVADIPNILLQYFIPIDVYVVMYSEQGERTVYTQRLEIIKRAKPSDYVYTETELLSYDMLERQIKEIKDNLPTKTSDLQNDSGFVDSEALEGYVKDTDYATYEKAGLLKLDRASGLRLDNNNIYIDSPNDTELKEKKAVNAPLKPQMIDKIVKYGLVNNQLDWTDEERIAVATLLGKQGAVPNSIVQRYSSGNIAVPVQPTADVHSTSKKYVDESIANYGQLELINEVEISEEITALSISEDMNGEPFELRETILFYYYPKYVGSTDVPSYCFGMLNDTTTGKAEKRPFMYTNAIRVPFQNNSIGGYWIVDCDKKNKLRYEKKNNAYTYDLSPNMFSNSYGNNISEGYQANDEIGTITSIGFTGGLAFEGCKFILYGVRA